MVGNMILFLLDMSGIFISVGTGLVTTLIIGATAFLWKINGTLSVIMEKLSHMDTLASLSNQRWGEKFAEMQKDVESLRAEVHDMRRGSKAA